MTAQPENTARTKSRAALRAALTGTEPAPPPPYRPEPLFPTRRDKAVLVLSMLTAIVVGFLTADWSWYG